MWETFDKSSPPKKEKVRILYVFFNYILLKETSFTLFDKNTLK